MPTYKNENQNQMFSDIQVLLSTYSVERETVDLFCRKGDCRKGDMSFRITFTMSTPNYILSTKQKKQ